VADACAATAAAAAEACAAAVAAVNFDCKSALAARNEATSACSEALPPSPDMALDLVRNSTSCSIAAAFSAVNFSISCCKSHSFVDYVTGDFAHRPPPPLSAARLHTEPGVCPLLCSSFTFSSRSNARFSAEISSFIACANATMSEIRSAKQWLASHLLQFIFQLSLAAICIICTTPVSRWESPCQPRRRVYRELHQYRSCEDESFFFDLDDFDADLDDFEDLCLCSFSFEEDEDEAEDIIRARGAGRTVVERTISNPLNAFTPNKTEIYGELNFHFETIFFKRYSTAPIQKKLTTRQTCIAMYLVRCTHQTLTTNLPSSANDT
jgi:hypothetical protein